MSGGFTGQRVPEEAVERDRGSLFSIVHLRVSIFCSSLLPRGQRNISPPTRGGREPERNPTGKLFTHKSFASPHTDFGGVQIYPCIFQFTGQTEQAHASVTILAGGNSLLFFLCEQMLDNSSDLNVFVFCMGKGKWEF